MTARLYTVATISYFRKVWKSSRNSVRRGPPWIWKLGRVPGARDQSVALYECVHGVFNQPWGDKPVNNKKNFGLSTSVTGPTYLEYIFFSYLHHVFYAVGIINHHSNDIFKVQLACRLLMDWRQLIGHCCAFLRYTCTYMYCVSRILDIFEFRQRLLVTWCIFHVRTCATIMFS